MKQFIVKLTARNGTGFYTGNDFDTERKAAKVLSASSETDEQLILELIAKKFQGRISGKLETVSIAKRKTVNSKVNPRKKSAKTKARKKTVKKKIPDMKSVTRKKPLRRSPAKKRIRKKTSK